MNERPAPADDDARRWACATLGVAEDTPLAVIRAAFLKQIGEADFYPSAESVVAWQSMSGHVAANPRARRILSQQVNQGLRKQVEQFAEAFFSIKVEERVHQWFDLNSRCQSSAALSARLGGLSAGLHVDRDAVLASLPSAEGAASDAGPSEREVANSIFELFVLRPLDRAERQQELLEAWQADLKPWQSAARTFKKQFPKIAELEAEFVDTVLDTSRPAPRAKLTSTAYSTSQPQPATTKSGRSWPATIGVFVVLMCVSAISRCSQESNRTKLPSGQRLTRDEMEDIKRMLRTLKVPRKGEPAPMQANDNQPIVNNASPMAAETRSQQAPSETPSHEDALARERARLEREVERSYFRKFPDRISPDTPLGTEPSSPARQGDEPAPQQP